MIAGMPSLKIYTTKINFQKSARNVNGLLLEIFGRIYCHV